VLTEDMPRRSFVAGDVVVADGESSPALFVLLEGGLRIEKNGVSIATVTDRGSCVGEISLLLGVPATADVIATGPSTVAVLENARRELGNSGALALALARLLAVRLQVMTTYLADIKRQYADHDGGLGMVDVVLEALMRSSGERSELGSDRDPYPES